MKEKLSNPGKNNLHYNIETWIKQGSFDILHGISEIFTLVHLMDIFGNFNNAVSIVVYRIFESDYKN